MMRWQQPDPNENITDAALRDLCAKEMQQWREGDWYLEKVQPLMDWVRQYKSLNPTFRIKEIIKIAMAGKQFQPPRIYHDGPEWMGPYHVFTHPSYHASVRYLESFETWGLAERFVEKLAEETRQPETQWYITGETINTNDPTGMFRAMMNIAMTVRVECEDRS